MTPGSVSDEIYCSNDLKMLMGRKNSGALCMGQKKINYFRTMNYCTVAEIGDLDGNVAAIADLVTGMRGLTKPFFMSIIATCRLNVKERTPEDDINHLQATNLFASQYGHDPWGV